MGKIKSMLLAATVSAALLSGAYAANVPQLSGAQYSDPSQVLATINQLIATINTWVSGRIAALPGPIFSIATTTEQVFTSTQIASNTLNGAGQALRVRCSGVSAQNGTSKKASLVFGTASVGTNAWTSPGQAWDLEMLITYATAANAWTYVGRGFVGSNASSALLGGVVVASNDKTDDLSTAITTSCRGQLGTGGAASDLVEMNFTVEQVK